jgi:hypothetical protein
MLSANLGSNLSSGLISSIFSSRDSLSVIDNFTDTNNTSITSHTGDKNAVWQAQTTTITQAVIVNNRLSGRASSNVYRTSYVMPTPNYSVYAKFDFIADFALVGCGIVGRATADGQNTFYALRYDKTSGNWLLFKSINGATTNLGTYVETFNSGSREILLYMNGSNIQGIIDGVARINVTDTGITGAGSAGVRTTVMTTDTAGIHIDKFEAKLI